MKPMIDFFLTQFAFKVATEKSATQHFISFQHSPFNIRCKVEMKWK